MEAAHKIWEALGVPDRMGVSMRGLRNHCLFPDDHRKLLKALVDKFLVRNGDVDFDTNVVENMGAGVEVLPRQWVDWEVTMLE